MTLLNKLSNLQKSDHKHLVHPWLNWDNASKDNLIIESAKGAYVTAYIRHVDCNRLIKMRVGKRSQDVSSVDHRFFRNRSKQTLMHSVL